MGCNNSKSDNLKKYKTEKSDKTVLSNSTAIKVKKKENSSLVKIPNDKNIVSSVKRKPRYKSFVDYTPTYNKSIRRYTIGPIRYKRRGYDYNRSEYSNYRIECNNNTIDYNNKGKIGMDDNGDVIFGIGNGIAMTSDGGIAYSIGENMYLSTDGRNSKVVLGRIL